MNRLKQKAAGAVNSKKLEEKIHSEYKTTKENSIPNYDIKGEEKGIEAEASDNNAPKENEILNTNNQHSIQNTEIKREENDNNTESLDDNALNADTHTSLNEGHIKTNAVSGGNLPKKKKKKAGVGVIDDMRKREEFENSNMISVPLPEGLRNEINFIIQCAKQKNIKRIAAVNFISNIISDYLTENAEEIDEIKKSAFK